MWIKKVGIKNFRLFTPDPWFKIDNLNIPDGQNDGTGLTVIIGENGCGKTSLLDAIALPFLSYKADGFQLNDFNDPNQNTEIVVKASENFTVNNTMPRGSFLSNGFRYEASKRARENKAYLSSIVVTDQKYIRADGEVKPKDGSPDLRVNVNNPFSGKRFDENDILYLDKNRTYQVRSGTYNPTRFDRIMEDFDYKYIKDSEDIQNLNRILMDVIETGEGNEFLTNAISKFKEMSNSDIELNLVDNWKPFTKGFFAERKENNQLVNLNMLGSGYEMVFSLIYAFYLSKQSGKQLIALIDEPELHLHPLLQEKFVMFLIEISKVSQIILTSQSPLLIKYLLENEKINVLILDKNEGTPELFRMDDGVLPYISSNEINYIAFKLHTVEYHNELYGHLQEKSEKYRIQDFDNWINSDYRIELNKIWIKKLVNGITRPEPVSLLTYIRNSIHHPENPHNDSFTPRDLKDSIDLMVEIIKNIDANED